MVLLLSFVIVIAGIQFVKSQNETNDLYAHLHNSSDFTTSIINGQKVSLGNYPWFASVDMNNNGKLYPICGGTLISKNWVLTAAHCIHEVKYAVEIGKISKYNYDGVTIRNVDFVCAHTGFNSNTFENDIALLHLNKPAYGVQTLSYGLSDIYENMPLKIIGMGSIDPQINLFASHLMEADVHYMNKNKCKKTWSNMVDNKKICAIGWDQDACVGDSGGPLLSWEGNRWVQEGIISFGSHPCNDYGVPVLYTNVQAMKPWIQMVMDGDYRYCS